MHLVLQAPDHVSNLSVELGDEVRLSFRHSIYGSLVEEAFRVAAEGLQFDQLRYAEPRVAHYYGHEHASLIGGWWVVHRAPQVQRSLQLRVSRESEMRIATARSSMNLTDMIRTGISVPVSITVDGVV